MKAIGTIHTPFDNLEDMPIQPKGAGEIIGTVELEEQYVAGLADLDGFSHIYLLYEFHMAKRTALTVTPFMDTSPRGVFATRSPLRPNHIGISIVRLIGIAKNILTVQGIDILNGSPLLDIKPYIAAFDAGAGKSIGLDERFRRRRCPQAIGPAFCQLKFKSRDNFTKKIP